MKTPGGTVRSSRSANHFSHTAACSRLLAASCSADCAVGQSLNLLLPSNFQAGPMTCVHGVFDSNAHLSPECWVPWRAARVGDGMYKRNLPQVSASKHGGGEIGLGYCLLAWNIFYSSASSSSRRTWLPWERHRSNESLTLDATPFAADVLDEPYPTRAVAPCVSVADALGEFVPAATCSTLPTGASAVSVLRTCGRPRRQTVELPLRFIKQQDRRLGVVHR